MKISYFLFFFFSVLFMAESLLAAQRPGPRAGYGAQQLASGTFSDDDFASEGDDGFEDDLADDLLPPRPSPSGRRAVPSFGPSARPKFQQPSRMNTPPKKTVIPEDDYGDDGFEDDLVDDRLPPRSGASARQAPGYLAPASRGGFQQKSGMNAPQRIAPMPEDDYGDENFEDRPLEDQKKSEYLPAELPPRNYPPKMTHLQFGQTEWNQMDLHSLVDGRKA